ncbi:MAG: type VII secretion integral membrane protein EccD [Gordonia sp. (in: high G+C Gram-positive bacteria)]|uniref:type VII secretion integral membrane protein EccD n=1 Tax=Gordonia sp. (in: high G+C Gram-positive bacteria) TaxID=84139 RepID=UPI0039E7078D
MTVTAEPEPVRISILGASTQVDVALPARTPIAALIGDLLVLLRVPDPPTDDPDSIDLLPRWTLARIGAPPLPVESSLAEAGVVDGELLVIHRNLPEAPGALVDDVVDGLAHLADARAPGWTTDSARVLGYAVCGAVTALAVLAGRAAADAPLLIGTVSAVCAVILTAAAVLGARFGADPRGIATLSWCAFPTAALAGSFVPPADAASSTVIAAACGLVSVLVVHRATGCAPRLHAALGTVAALSVVGGLAATGLPTGFRGAAAVTAVVGLFTVVVAARLAIAASRLPLPPVPSTLPPAPENTVAEHPIDGVDAMAPDPVEAVADLALVDLGELERRSALASEYLTGIVLGAVSVTAAAVLAVSFSYGGTVQALLFCAAVAATLLARGRTHVDRVQSTALLAGGAVCVLAVPAGTGSAVILCLSGFALAATAFLIGVTADSHSFSPLQRRALELAEYAVIAVIVPLLLWLLDAYRAVREL